MYMLLHGLCTAWSNTKRISLRYMATGNLSNISSVSGNKGRTDGRTDGRERGRNGGGKNERTNERTKEGKKRATYFQTCPSYRLHTGVPGTRGDSDSYMTCRWLDTCRRSRTDPRYTGLWLRAGRGQEKVICYIITVFTDGICMKGDYWHTLTGILSWLSFITSEDNINIIFSKNKNNLKKTGNRISGSDSRCVHYFFYQNVITNPG